MSLADDALKILTAAGKGAAAGSVVPGIGTGVGAAIGVAMDLVPDLAKWVGGSAETAAQVVQTVQAVTGTADPVKQQAALSDPGVVNDLKIQLAQIAADHEQAMEEARLDRFKAVVGDVADARRQTLQLAQAGSPLAWGTPIVSAIVLLAFGALTWVVLSRSIPQGSEQIAMVMLGTLGTLATAVVSYYVGSSAGSSDKASIIADLAKNTVPAKMMPHPAAVVPAEDVKPQK